MKKNMKKTKNETGRSVHRNTKSLEDAVASFVADVRNMFDRQDREKETHKKNWHSLRDVAPALRKLEEALLAHRGEAPEVPRKPYERKVRRDSIRDHEVEETHESYGLVQINRVQGDARLFGSSLRHQHFFMLRVYRARRLAHDYGERFSTDGRVPIVEVHLSPSQFVEMITTMNYGEGTPCTLDSVEGVDMDPTPEDAGSELKLMVEMFEDRTVEIVDELRRADTDLKKLLNKKSFNKEDKAAIQEAVTRARRFLDDSAPFVLKTFGEHAEKMVAKGKHEVESFIALALQKAGIKSIKDGGGHLLLGSGDEEEQQQD